MRDYTLTYYDRSAIHKYCFKDCTVVVVVMVMSRRVQQFINDGIHSVLELENYKSRNVIA